MTPLFLVLLSSSILLFSFGLNLLSFYFLRLASTAFPNKLFSSSQVIFTNTSVPPVHLFSQRQPRQASFFHASSKSHWCRALSRANNPTLQQPKTGGKYANAFLVIDHVVRRKTEEPSLVGRGEPTCCGYLIRGSKGAPGSTLQWTSRAVLR